MIRRFTLSDDAEWVVFDVVPHFSATLGSALKHGWLCFEAGDERRRFAPIPENWQRFSEGDLAAVWAQATPVAHNGEAP